MVSRCTPSARNTACTNNGIRSVWSESSPHSTFRWRFGRGTRSSPPSAATSAYGSPRPRRRCARSRCRRSATACLTRHASAADLPAVHRCGQRARRAIHRRPARRAGLLHGLDCSGPQGRRARRGAVSARACWNWAATTRSSSTSSANLDLAVPSIVFGAVGTAGQRCTSTRRVFVHRSRQAELEKRLLRCLRAGQDRRPAGTRVP